MDETQSTDNPPYCAKAGIQIESLKRGKNNINYQLAEDILVNGCVAEVYKLHPTWAALTSWLSVWMGNRFPQASGPPRVAYFTKRLVDMRKQLLRKRTVKNQEALKNLDGQPFRLPPLVSHTTSAIASPCNQETVLSSSQSAPDPSHSDLPPLPPGSSNSPLVLPVPVPSSIHVSSSSPSLPVLTPPSLSSPVTSSHVASPSPSLPVLTLPLSRFIIQPSFTPSPLPSNVASSSTSLPVLTPPSSSSLVPSSHASLQPAPLPPSTPALCTSLLLPALTSPSSILLLQPSFTTSPVDTCASQMLSSLSSTPIRRPVESSVSSSHTAAFVQMKRTLLNSKAREKRKNIKILKQKVTLKSQEKQIAKLRKINGKQKERNEQRFQKIMKLRRAEREVSIQVTTPCEVCERYEEDLTKLQEKLEETAPQDEGVDFLEGPKYNNKLTQCVLFMLDHNVASHNISPIIHEVLKLVGVTATQLPCRRTVEEIGKLRHPLSLLNIAATMPEEKNTTFYSDETSKFGHQYETYLLTGEDQQPKLLGIREIADKSASTNLETIKEVLSDLDKITAANNEQLGKKILANIKNTMSDRAATESCFQDLLKSYRRSVLPEVIPNWTGLSEPLQDKISELHNFICGLHLLVNFAEKAAETLKQFEAKVSNSSSVPTDSAVVNFIRISSKAFSRGGDEKSGCYGKISAFLCDRGIKYSLSQFKGNRFNIIFHNSSILYHLRTHFSDYLEEFHGARNDLLNAVATDLKSDLCIAGCRALGLLNKFLTKPLWNATEQKSNILDMNTIYAGLISNMKNTPTSSVLDGTAVLVPGSQPQDGSDEFTSLTTPCSDDALTEGVLEVLLADLASLLERVLKDQLPGGKYSSPSEILHTECQSTIKHNKGPESVFGRLDYEQHRKPSALAYTHESKILYNFNKVGDWLENMEDEQHRQLILKASVLRKTSFLTFKNRQKELKKKKMEVLLAKQKEIQKRKERAIQQNRCTHPAD